MLLNTILNNTRVIGMGQTVNLMVNYNSFNLHMRLLTLNGKLMDTFDPKKIYGMSDLVSKTHVYLWNLTL